MGLYSQRWLVLYTDRRGASAAAIIVDRQCAFPFGVTENEVADDCARLIAFVPLPDDYTPFVIAMDDREVPVRTITRAEPQG